MIDVATGEKKKKVAEGLKSRIMVTMLHRVISYDYSSGSPNWEKYGN